MRRWKSWHLQQAENFTCSGSDTRRVPCNKQWLWYSGLACIKASINLSFQLWGSLVSYVVTDISNRCHSQSISRAYFYIWSCESRKLIWWCLNHSWIQYTRAVGLRCLYSFFYCLTRDSFWLATWYEPQSHCILESRRVWSNWLNGRSIKQDRQPLPRSCQNPSAGLIQP